MTKLELLELYHDFMEKHGLPTGFLVIPEDGDKDFLIFSKNIAPEQLKLFGQLLIKNMPDQHSDQRTLN